MPVPHVFVRRYLVIVISACYHNINSMAAYRPKEGLTSYKFLHFAKKFGFSGTGTVLHIQTAAWCPCSWLCCWSLVLWRLHLQLLSPTLVLTCLPAGTALRSCLHSRMLLSSLLALTLFLTIRGEPILPLSPCAAHHRWYQHRVDINQLRVQVGARQVQKEIR